MKKLFILFAASALVLSCTKGLSERSSSNNQGDLQTIYASQCNGVETKNMIDDSSAEITWTAGDAINVFFGTSLNSKFVTSESGKNYYLYQLSRLRVCALVQRVRLSQMTLLVNGKLLELKRPLQPETLCLLLILMKFRVGFMAWRRFM